MDRIFLLLEVIISRFHNILSNVNTSFRGCLHAFNVNSRTFDIQNAIENIGVTRGCSKEVRL